MNKQEALVAILEECRTHEQPHEETRRADPDDLLERMLEDAMAFRTAVRTASTVPPLDYVQAQLLRLAGAALYLLVDQVEIVAGRTLDQWLADTRLLGYRLPLGVLPGPRQTDAIGGN